MSSWWGKGRVIEAGKDKSEAGNNRYLGLLAASLISFTHGSIPIPHATLTPDSPTAPTLEVFLCSRGLGERVPDVGKFRHFFWPIKYIFFFTKYIPLPDMGLVSRTHCR